MENIESKLDTRYKKAYKFYEIVNKSLFSTHTFNFEELIKALTRKENPNIFWDNYGQNLVEKNISAYENIPNVPKTVENNNKTSIIPNNYTKRHKHPIAPYVG